MPNSDHPRADTPTKISHDIMINIYKNFIKTNIELPNSTDPKNPNEIDKTISEENLSGSENYDVSTKVLERLLLRHAILKNMEKIEGEYAASASYVPRVRRILVSASDVGISASGGPASDDTSKAPEQNAGGTEAEIGGAESEPPRPEKIKDQEKKSETYIEEFKIDRDSERTNRVYRLAATDLFVEKAIAYLERDSAKYLHLGEILFRTALGTVFFGIPLSGWVFLYGKDQGNGSAFASIPKIFLSRSELWIDFASSFVKGFTFYGFLVLFAVFCVRLGKALLDQAERLRERRHSLRQGRLYIHLSNGEVTIEELEKAFDWNVSKGNAFGNIPTEASAPWGTVIKEALKAIPEAFKKAKGSLKD